MGSEAGRWGGKGVTECSCLLLEESEVSPALAKLLWLIIGSLRLVDPLGSLFVWFELLDYRIATCYMYTHDTCQRSPNMIEPKTAPHA